MTWIKIDHYFFWFTASLMLFSFSLSAQNHEENLASFYYYEDVGSALRFTSISNPSNDITFLPLSQNGIWHGITESTIWLKFRYDDASETQHYLEISSSNFHEVTYYQPYTKGEYKEFVTGFLSDYNSRPIKIDRFAFPITNGQEWHYVKLRSGHFMNTEFNILTGTEIIRSDEIRYVFYSLYAGLMFIVVVGVLFYIFSLKYYGYLSYIGYIVLISFLNLTEKGFNFQLLWPHYPQLNFYFPLLPFGVSIFLLLFLKGIWKLKRITTPIYYINLWFVTLIPFIITCFFLLQQHYQAAIVVAQIHSILSSLLVIIISVVSYLTSDGSCKAFIRLIIAGLCFFCIGVIIYLLSQNHLLSINFLTDNAVIFGSTVEVCFFTSALILHSGALYENQRNKLINEFQGRS